MPSFKVGDRVKIVGPSISGRATEIGKVGAITNGLDRQHDCQVLVGETYGIRNESSLELAPRFRVGDEVRVKAGYEMPQHKGEKICVTGLLDDANGSWVRFNGEEAGWGSYRFEPWNPAEEWDGSAWVKKREEVAKPCIVKRRGDFRAEDCESTNAAFRKADELAAQNPGVEFVVYQEKGGRKVDSHAEKVFEFMKARNGKSLAQLYIFFPANELVQESVERDGDYLNIRCKIRVLATEGVCPSSKRKWRETCERWG